MSRELEFPIEELDLGLEVLNKLKRVGIERLGDLLKYSDAELLAIPGIRDTRLAQIKSAVESYEREYRINLREMLDEKYLGVRIEIPDPSTGRYYVWSFIAGPHDSDTQLISWKSVFDDLLGKLNEELGLGIMTCMSAEYTNLSEPSEFQLSSLTVLTSAAPEEMINAIRPVYAEMVTV